MERCPHCRARLKGHTSCGRCGVELDLVLTLETQAEIMARKAVRSLAAGNLPAAAVQAAVAHDLHATPFHRALAGFVAARKELMEINESS